MHAAAGREFDLRETTVSTSACPSDAMNREKTAAEE